MHTHNLDKWKPQHDFLIENQKAERKSFIILILTAVTMVAEIIAGIVFGSMALLADGWHMATHVAAFAITLFAYSFARKHKDNPRFTFSTGKVGVLGGFASAVSLLVVAMFMAIESIGRFFTPSEIFFTEALIVASIGLAVNIFSVIILHESHSHEEEEHDHNLKAAYFHVLADALTSILAIGALLMGKYYQLNWLDPLMGIVGSVIIAKWAFGLINNSSSILLDNSIDEETKQKIFDAIENEKDTRIADFHAWYVSQRHLIILISIVTHYPQDPKHYKDLIKNFTGEAHLTIEVNTCSD